MRPVAATIVRDPDPAGVMAAGGAKCFDADPMAITSIVCRVPLLACPALLWTYDDRDEESTS